MKKLILPAFFCAVSTIASAQFILGGQFTFSTSTDKDEDDDKFTTTSVTLLPRLAYDLGNNWWVGGDVGVTLLSQKEEFGGFETKSNVTLFTVSPFARRIWKPLDNMGIWLEGQAGASFGGLKEEDEKTEEYFIFSAGIRPGVIFFIGDRLSFEASFGRLGFSSISTTYPDRDDDKDTTSQFGLAINNNFGGFLFGEAFFSGFVFGVNCRL